MKAQRFTAIFFVSVLAVMIFLVFAGIVMRAAEKLTGSPENTDPNVVHIDWDKLYPFESGGTYADEPKLSLFAFMKEKITNYTSEKMAGRFTLVEGAKTYEELIGWNMTTQGYNPVLKLNDGYLSDITESLDITENAEAVKGLDEFCRGMGIEYAYISLPAKICQSEDTYISGFLDFSNQNTDRLLDALGRAGVRYYDLRKTLHAEGIDHHGAFFRTDHHWKPETGLWAAKHVLEFLRDDYGWDVEPEILDPERFEHKVYPEWFLGSQGKKLSLMRTQPDDFTMLYPKFRTLIHYEAPNDRVNTSGDFSVTYYMKSVERKDYYGLNPYGAYKHADQPLDRIHNLLNHDGRKILIIHGSMSNCVIPLIALGVEYTDAIDLRHFTGSLRSYIKATKPDMVIVSYYAKTPGRSSKSQRPNNRMYDFR